MSFLFSLQFHCIISANKEGSVILNVRTNSPSSTVHLQQNSLKTPFVGSFHFMLHFYVITVRNKQIIRSSIVLAIDYKNF